MTGTEGKTGHDNVAKYIHWLLCGNYDMQREYHWWKHNPDSVTEKNFAQILWDFNIIVDYMTSARWPDIVIIDKVSAVITMIDVSIPADNHLSLFAKENNPYVMLSSKTSRLPTVVVSLSLFDFRAHA